MRNAMWLGILLAAMPAAAQEVETGVVRRDGARYGGAGFFLPGVLSLQTGGLDDALGEAGRGVPGDLHLVLGGGGYFRLDRLIIGGEGGSFLPRSASRSGFETTITGGYGMGQVGFVVVDSWPVWIYPLVGFGGGGMSVNLSPSTSRKAGFDEALRSPASGTSLSTGGWLAFAGVGADMFAFGREDDEGASGWIVGLRAGYLLPVGGGSWSVQDQDVAGGPDTGIQGFVVKLALGGGGFSIR